jgi:hypothetical protein
MGDRHSAGTTGRLHRRRGGLDDPPTATLALPADHRPRLHPTGSVPDLIQPRDHAIQDGVNRRSHRRTWNQNIVKVLRRFYATVRHESPAHSRKRPAFRRLNASGIAYLY